MFAQSKQSPAEEGGLHRSVVDAPLPEKGIVSYHYGHLKSHQRKGQCWANSSHSLW